MAQAMTSATPAAMRTSPTLKTLLNGTHGGRAKMSVNGSRTGRVTTALFE
jgi:hypothetical protein